MSLGHADKWGPIGSIIAALCCLGAAPVLAALAAVGLGFLINDLILIPFLALFLGVTVFALSRDRPRHGNSGPTWLAAAASLLSLGSLWISSIIVLVGLLLLVAASLWNLILIRQPVKG